MKITHLKVDISENIRHSVHPVLAQVLANRGVESMADINYALKGLIHFDKMLNIKDAAVVVAEAIVANKNIVISMDYDADGCTAGSIMCEGLSILGSTNHSYCVPDRFKHGYGFSIPYVESLVSRGIRPDVLITVDNGISNVEGVARLKELLPNCTVIITDHHLAPEILPNADVIVNPNQKGCPFPSKALAGCGVAFYLIAAVRRFMVEAGFHADYCDIASLLDLVALGTVADVVPLDRNNRILVKAGLDRINAGYARPGIAALLVVGKRQIGKIVSSDFGFTVGPRLNAAGRLEDMTIGIRCLLSQTYEEALVVANELDDLNKKRRVIEQKMSQSAMADLKGDCNEFGLCFYSPEWHKGVVGIVSSRVKEKTNRPVICFGAVDEHGMISGSARSIKGLHLRNILEAIDVQNVGLIKGFGGHAMAAGLTIPESEFDRFSELFDKEVERVASVETLEGEVISDGSIPNKYMNLQTVGVLKHSTPWGQDFPEPTFDDYFDIDEIKIVGGKHLKYTLSKEGSKFAAIHFFALEEGEPKPTYKRARVVYQLQDNEFNNQISLQLIVQRLFVNQEELI
tara:strand:+ start:20219 stop:21937 length:1719 start_codon:yes stop_codon:yes gene_type:complete